MTKTAIIYARYSSDSQSEQSIEGQLRVCKEYAKNNNILILDTYIDRAMTGTNDNRPDFQRMIKDSNQKSFDYVLVYKFDRFSRNKYETAIHKKTLRDNGVKVISATEFVPDTPEGIISESMLEGYAEYYSAELSQKIRRGNNESRRKGNLTGGSIPFGYKNINKKAVIIPEEAEIVRYIFKQYSIGVCVREIINELQARNWHHKGRPFAMNTIYGILANERYSGIYRYNNEIFTNIYPPIVDKDIFDLVQQKVIRNKYGKTSAKTTYLLRNKAICGYCGHSIVGETGTARNGDKRHYYKCRGRKTHKTYCKKQTIRQDIFEKIVLDSIIEQLQTPHNIEFIVTNLLKEQVKQAKENVVLNLLLKEEKETNKSINNIMQAIENGGTSNTAMKRLRELESRQEKLEEQLIIEQNKASVILTEKQILEFYKKALQLEPSLLINYLVKQVVLFDDKIEIQFNTPLQKSPEDDSLQGFSLSTRNVNISYRLPFRINAVKHNFEINIIFK